MMTTPTYPVRLDGPRVVLRDFEPDDLDASMFIVGDPEVTGFLSFDARTREEQADRLVADIARAQTDPRPDYYLSIVAKDTGTLIGFARLGLVQNAECDLRGSGTGGRSGEVGAALRKDRWGEGYVTESTAVLLDFAFGALGLRRVQAACGPDNAASRAILPKLGFNYEARLRDHVFTNGAWRDSLLYSILDHEWHAGRS
jgi:[ribosomal protein S5]-alanine N-acetyltransferase